MNKNRNKIAAMMMVAAITVSSVAMPSEAAVLSNKENNTIERKVNLKNVKVTLDVKNFPDPGFRDYIMTITDKNENEVLSQEDLEKVTEICLYSDQAKDLTGIEYFPNVERIDVNGLGLTKLNLSNKWKLTYLNCSSNNLTSLDLSEATSIQDLNCGGNRIKQINLSACNSLIKLNSWHNSLNSINLSDCNALQELYLIENNLRSLDLSDNRNLKILHYGVIDEPNSLSSINFGNISSLQEIEVWRSDIKNVHLGNMPNLTNLRFESSPIKELDLSGCKNLKKLSVAYSSLNYLDLRNQNLLEELDLWQSRVSKIDLNPNANVNINGELVKPEEKHKKIIGTDRYETAAKIADHIADEIASYDTVILVNSDKSMADGLSAASLSGKENAPILLVKKDKIPKVAMDRINKASNVYIIGGENAISKNVEKQLKESGKKINRISGKDRYDTSKKIAELLGGYDKAFIVNGAKGEADAMSVSPVAAKYGAPILLTNGKTSIHDKKSGVKYYVVGGNSVVDNKLEEEYSAERIAGSDRYDTNIRIMNKFYEESWRVYFAKGDTLIDALTASALAKDDGIVLVSKNKNHSELKEKYTVQVGGMNFEINFN